MDQPFALDVDLAGRFVQDEDVGVLEEMPVRAKSVAVGRRSVVDHLVPQPFDTLRQILK